jgi:glucose/arabinose dehydrogenase
LNRRNSRSIKVKQCFDLANLVIVKYLLFFFPVLLVNLTEAQTLLPGFARVQVGSAISTPTVMAFAPDGRIFVAQQSGALRVIKNGVLLGTPFLSLTVNSAGERGLIGLAFDQDFVTNQYLYVYYTVPAAGSNPPFNRISRFTANGDVALAGSEQIVLNLDPLSSATNHNGGALAFGLDGKLYVAVGDNALGANAQNLNTYHGKLLRINKNGSAPSDNPFFTTGTTEQSKRVWAYGLRNPYTFSIQPVTGKIFVNDVGQNAVEEINDATTGGRNFGWPTAEGTSTNPNFTNPVYFYLHSGTAPTGCAITGGTFFNPEFTTYPASYVGDFFFQDYCSNWIYALDLSGTPTATLFASNVGSSSLSLTTGPDGNLYYLSRGAQALYKITSTNSTLPVIAQQPASATIPFGDPVTFSVSASGTAPLQFQWQKDGVDIEGATQNMYTINEVHPGDAGNYRVIITNIAGQVISNDATLTVTPNEKPIAQILTPIENTLYVAGTTISFSGSGTDTEDGTLSADHMSWQINFHHDNHKHDEPPRDGISEGTFEIPDQGETSANVWYRFILTVTDSKGSIGKDSVDVHPKKSMLNLATVPSGLQVTLDGQPHTTPFETESVEGLKREIGVVTEQSLTENDYVFVGWLHGGETTQLIVTPADDVTFTATFDLVLAANEVSEGIFPNPASDWIYLLRNDITGISITDVIGRTWNPLVVSQSDGKLIDVMLLPAGLYLLNYSLAHSSFKKKVLIQR